MPRARYRFDYASWDDKVRNKPIGWDVEIPVGDTVKQIQMEFESPRGHLQLDRLSDGRWVVSTNLPIQNATTKPSDSDDTDDSNGNK